MTEERTEARPLTCSRCGHYLQDEEQGYEFYCECGFKLTYCLECTMCSSQPYCRLCM